MGCGCNSSSHTVMDLEKGVPEQNLEGSPRKERQNYLEICFNFFDMVHMRSKSPEF